MEDKTVKHFSTAVAMDVGVEAAIMYANIQFWVDFNAKNKKNYHDGRYWMYNSLDAFVGQFPYWSIKTIRNILAKLEKNGYIQSGFHHPDKSRRTKWYTYLKEIRETTIIAEEVDPPIENQFNNSSADDHESSAPDHLPKRADGWLKRADGYAQKGKSLTDNKQDIITTDTNLIIAEAKNKDPVNVLLGLFYQINPSLNFGNKTQREAAEKLFLQLGLEQTIEWAVYAISLAGEKYAPVINTPLKLWNKLSDLAYFRKREDKKGNNVLKI